ncbi:MAG: nucleotidyltransferase domain-containing protein [Anaerolineales bacterium]|nr:nucleotidyltransferase domain-containing protein [Anaerolineales bacterium]
MTTTLPDLRLPIDQSVPMDVIKDIARLIAEKFDPDKIILFGSYAYGNPEPWSDVDLLVVMDTPKDDIEAALEIYHALPPRSFGMDVLVRSEAEIDRRIAIDDWFLEEITTQGKVLYARDN